MFTIEKPIYFLLLLLLPLLLVARQYYLSWQKKKQIEYGNPIALQKSILFHNATKELLRFYFLLEYFFQYFSIG